MTENSKQDQALAGIDESKRRTIKRLGLGAAFVTPVVASLSLDALTISKAHATQTVPPPNGSTVIGNSRS
jgi:hypothetical protein